MQGLNGADINAVRWGVWYVKRSAMSVLVCKKEKEITLSKKVAICQLPRVFKRQKEKSQKKDRK